MTRSMWLTYSIPLLTFSVLFLASCTPQSSFSTADFARCLTEKGVRVYGYGTQWCSFCEQQRTMFGSGWQNLNYTECASPGDTQPSGLEDQAPECKDAGIVGYPTWESSDGQRIDGIASFVQLSELSGCPVPSEPTQEFEEGIIFIGLQETINAETDKKFSYSFCKPDVTAPGTTCGGLAGATTDPIGGNPPYSFLVRGILPPGLALNLNGLLAGTPTLEGNYNFAVCAEDAKGGEACTGVDMRIEAKKQVWKFTFSKGNRIGFYECRGGEFQIDGTAVFSPTRNFAVPSNEEIFTGIDGTLTSTSKLTRQITVLPQYVGKNTCSASDGATNVPVKYLTIRDRYMSLETDGDAVQLPYVYGSNIHKEESSLNPYILRMDITSISDDGRVISGVFPADEEELLRQELGGTFTLERIE